MNKKMLTTIALLIGAINGFAANADVDEWGGEITVWPDNSGLFCFVNAQNDIANDTLKGAVSFIESSFMIRINYIVGKEPNLCAISDALARLNAKGAIWIVSNPTLPTTLAATENGWGVLNVAPILVDKPTSEVIALRVQRLMNRLFGVIHGTSDPTMMPACVMKPAIGMTGIDNLPCTSYSPASVSKISSYLTLFGYKQCKRGFYYDACEEGWAPPPTNDIQRAIWKKVHELPTKPLTIQRESERK